MALKEHGFTAKKEIYDLEKVQQMISDLSGKLSSIYPVGSIYITTQYSFNPKSVYGGEWSRIADNTFLMSWTTKPSSGDYINVTGGNNSLVLSTDNLPAHTHQTSKTDNVSKPKVQWPNYRVGSNTGPNLGLSDPKVWANIDTRQKSADHPGEDDGCYLIWHPTEVENVTTGMNLKDGKLHMVNGLRNRKYGGTPSVNDAYEIEAGSTRTGSIGAGKAFDNRPQYMQVYMWRRTK